MDGRGYSHMDNGVILPDLAALLPKLKLPWEHTVLAAVMDPEDPGYTYVVVVKHPVQLTQPYVLYRVDRSDGSCHGGRYSSSLFSTLAVFAKRVATAQQALRERALGPDPDVENHPHGETHAERMGCRD